MKNAVIQKVIDERAELCAKGDELLVEGRKRCDAGAALCGEGHKLLAEGDELRDEGYALLVEGDKLLVEDDDELCGEGYKLHAAGDRVLSAAVEQLGKNVTIGWNGDGSCTIAGVTYTVTKGEQP